MEALVLPHLGPDIMLLDNSIMKSFGAKLDWLTECLSFQDSLETIPARHVKSPVQSKYCSISGGGVGSARCSLGTHPPCESSTCQRFKRRHVRRFGACAEADDTVVESWCVLIAPGV